MTMIKYTCAITNQSPIILLNQVNLARTIANVQLHITYHLEYIISFLKNRDQIHVHESNKHPIVPFTCKIIRLSSFIFISIYIRKNNLLRLPSSLTSAMYR